MDYSNPTKKDLAVGVLWSVAYVSSIVIFIVVVTLLCGCSSSHNDPYYDWEGKWNVESSEDISFLFDDSGIWGMVFFYEGSKFEFLNIGILHLTEDTFNFTVRSNFDFDLSYLEGVGTWELRGEKLILTFGDGTIVIMKREHK